MPPSCYGFLPALSYSALGQGTCLEPRQQGTYKWGPRRGCQGFGSPGEVLEARRKCEGVASSTKRRSPGRHGLGGTCPALLCVPSRVGAPDRADMGTPFDLNFR